MFLSPYAPKASVAFSPSYKNALLPSVSLVSLALEGRTPRYPFS